MRAISIVSYVLRQMLADLWALKVASPSVQCHVQHDVGKTERCLQRQPEITRLLLTACSRNSHVTPMKIDKRKSQLGWSWEACRGVLMPYHLQTQRKRQIFQGGIALLSQWEEEGLSSALATAQPMRERHNSANEKPLQFELSVYPNGLFVYSSLPKVPLPSIKRAFPFFGAFVYGFPTARSLTVAILCHHPPPRKTHFCG